MRIGLLGGSFNPVHRAHLLIAEQAQSACRLERVIFIPAADPPHKVLAGNIPFDQRCRMVQLAISGKAGFEISTIEGERLGKSYSIDTIRIFRELYPQDDLFFIIGGDSFLEISSWSRYADIFCACNLIVVERPGCLIPDRLAAVPADIRDEFSYQSATDRLQHRSGTQVCFVRGCPQDVSSTEIRNLAAESSSIEQLVPSDVAAYILKQRIYHS
ncbi:MAG TPA: nicotinate (nicotinamide) nucleotide adenylyltransferase [Desulfuromonadales bacterium]|nr:nicotinate (nicotinamide) nucleotide adenylyltransferase [Desulfuromonadales bacterium]